MARHSRLTFPGVALHIVQRGNDRGACFRQDGDYLTYLAYLRRLSDKYGCAVHAYCLMTNHVHLLLTPAAAEGCALLMRDLGPCYVRYFNRRHGRSGTLWEGRYRSCIVESARYVLGCYRYVESNPVRARMVAQPGGYPWSSYAANAGLRADALVTHNPEYLALAAEPAPRQAAYRGLFERSMEEDLLRSVREATQGGYPLASDAFKSALPPGSRLARDRPGPRLTKKIATLTPN